MPITLLTGLAGSGKSTRLLETVNAALEQGRPTLTFACSDAPWLKGREDINVYQVLTCRRPGLVAPLHHFVSAEQSADILQRTPPGTLVAFEEAQYFGPSLVPHWLEADRRGLHLLIASPSGGQLRRLDGHACDRVHLVIRCQRCGAADAVHYFRLPDREATVSVCESCREEMLREGHRQILQRLRAMPPSPGQAVTEQPVELPECAGWRVTRPDCRAIAGLMAFTIRRAGLGSEGSRLMSYLDVGCGTGYFCHQLRKMRFFCEGIDASEENITVARLLDSYLRRDHNAWTIADPCEYLSGARERRFDVTSAFNAGRWFPGDDGAACLRRLFDMSDRLCFVSAGPPTGSGFENDAVARRMLVAGVFADVVVYEAAGHGLASDLCVGIKVRGGHPAQSVRRVSAPSTVGDLLEEVDTLSGRLARKSKMLDTLMARLASRLSPTDLLDGSDGGLPAELARELTDLREQLEAEKKAAEYRALVGRVRTAAHAVLPADADVAVVSRGDDELLKLEGRTARHFPQNEAGVYSGSYPADSGQAVAQLESLRAKGVSHLLLPSTSFWWLDHYDGLRRHIEGNGRLVAHDSDCAIYELAPARAAAGASFPSSVVNFLCNICGSENVVPPARLEREARSCSGCGSSVRLRAVIHVLSTELFGRSLPLLEFPQRKDLVGAGMTDPDGYAMGLARTFSYTNTYYHQEPRLDITAPGVPWEGSLDFLICSEVFEHVPPPVSLAFDNLRRIMKPGGVVVFTVPYTKADRTVEHFPDLCEYRIAVENGRHVLRNRTRDGREQAFERLVFHGGPGETLEMRVFGEADLVREFRRAGFAEVKVYREPCAEYGIYWRSDEGLPVSARVAASTPR